MVNIADSNGHREVHHNQEENSSESEKEDSRKVEKTEDSRQVEKRFPEVPTKSSSESSPERSPKQVGTLSENSFSGSQVKYVFTDLRTY